MNGEKRNVETLTLGLWANSIRVGVPGLREIVCGCDIADSLTGETGRSLLQNEQPDAMLEDVQRENSIDISVQADMCWLTRAQCYTSYGEHQVEGDTHHRESKFRERSTFLMLDGTKRDMYVYQKKHKGEKRRGWQKWYLPRIGFRSK